MKKSNKKKTQAGDLRNSHFRWIWLGLAAILLFAAGVRWHLRSFPLERDEGEYVYQGQLILQGKVPFEVAYSSQKFPGIYLAAAAAQRVFGDPPAGIRLGLLVVNLSSIVLLFWLARKWLGDIGALMAAAVFALNSVSHSVLGFAAHATHFVVLPVLCGLWALDRAHVTGKLPWFLTAGLFLGISVTMRQPAVFFGIWVFVWIWVHARREGISWLGTLPRALAYGMGSVLPIALMVLWLWRAGVWDRFFFWTFTYAASYGSQQTLASGWMNFWENIQGTIGVNWPLWILAALGAGWVLWKRPHFWIEWAGLGLASLLAVASGLYFRQHYYIQFLPFLALSAGAGLLPFLQNTGKTKPAHLVPAIAIGLLVWICAFAGQEKYLFEMKPDAFSRAVYGANPFPEAVEIGRYLREHTKPEDTVAVLGSEPEIYAYSQRRAATGYYITYPLTELTTFARGMQEEMIREIETSRPRYLVVVNVYTSWLFRPESETLILKWLEPYLQTHYRLAGSVDIAPTGSVIHWGQADLEAPLPNGPSLLVYQRKEDPSE
jgi:hypothetical protein